MLESFMVCLPDRYDHQQRLLPYILSFNNDNMPDVQNTAVQCIEKCGLQYESEHPDEVVERRQFGVDGEEEIDYNTNLPKPFTCRPSLGARLFVRANASRFFLALLGELSNWREQTRKRSAELLLILSVYCEEHMTNDFQHTIKSIAKAVDVEKSSSQSDNDRLETLKKLQEVLCLMAKYVEPATYLPLVCPRIAGDSSSATSNAEDGSHSERARSSYAFILSSLIEGTPLPRLIPHWLTLVSLLSDANCIGPFSGTQTRSECLNSLLSLISRVVSKDGDTNRLLIERFSGTNEWDQFHSALSFCIESLREFQGLNTADAGGGGDAEVAACIDCIDRLSQVPRTQIRTHQ